jgi:hypothetical protein
MPQDIRNDNHRLARRQRVLKQGKILLANNLSVVDCVVRDMSETGARLLCGDQAAVPGEFRLVTPSDSLMREAKVIWRRDGQLGVRFAGPARPAPPLGW